MKLPYDKQTINSPNPLARFAHRNRLRKSVELTLARLPPGGRVLDYGCGNGAFITELLALCPCSAIGFEPFMQKRSCDALPIFNNLEEVISHGPFSLVTLFETIEHLTEVEMCNFLRTCDNILPPTGGILLSGPVEIGPALIAKELNRSLSRFRMPEYRPFEFIKASIFGIAARRAENIKISHRGFDFRVAIRLLNKSGWRVEVLHFGPLPIRTWYGNSQFYLWLTRPFRACLK